MEDQLIKLFVDKKLLTEQQLSAAKKEQKQTRELLIEVIIRLGLADREKVSRIWAQATGHPYVDLPNTKVDAKAVSMVPIGLAERFKLVPIGLENGTIQIAMYNPGNIIAVDALRRATQKNIEICVANLESISEAISIHYGKGDASSSDEIERLAATAVSGTTDTDASEPPWSGLLIF